MARQHPAPVSWVRPGHGTPASFAHDQLADDAPPGIAELQAVARILDDMIGAQVGWTDGAVSITQLARDAGVARSTVHDLINGQIVIDTVTLARLEAAAGRRLWPS